MTNLSEKVKEITGSYNPTIERCVKLDVGFQNNYIDFTDRSTGRFPENQEGLELLETEEVLFWAERDE